MSVKLHIKKGDMVYVNAGDSKGQQGKVLKVDAQKQRAIVEGVNISKKATKPNAKNPQGGIIEQESAIHISNLQVLFCNVYQCFHDHHIHSYISCLTADRSSLHPH